MFFENYGVNPFLDTEDDHFSTFSMDVDSGSYTLARNYLMEVGTLPPAEAIRPEEFINYFDMNYEPPEGEDAFAIYLDAAPAPFGFEDHYLFRVGLQGRYVAPEDRDPALLIFVIDVSGSMADGGRLELVKRSLALLLDELRPEDRVGIVVYTDTAWPVLEPISVTERETILNAVNSLYPMNSTNVQDGLFQGYQMAERYRLRGEITRVILLSDGVANQGVVDPQGILDSVSRYAENGITLTAIGVGMGNYNDVLMEQLANDGDGSYHYVDTLREAERVFVYGLTSTLQVIAYDAKVQVEFNREVVDRYRLIGYENRAIADEDFRDDTVDAGEVGAGAEPESDEIGHNVTALYEMALENPDLPRDAVIATVYVRYQDAETREVVELQRQITVADLLNSFEEAPANFRLAAAAAEFAELLRESYWAQDGSYVDLLEFAQALETAYPNDDDVLEFVSLIRIAGRYVDQ